MKPVKFRIACATLIVLSADILMLFSKLLKIEIETGISIIIFIILTPVISIISHYLSRNYDEDDETKDNNDALFICIIGFLLLFAFFGLTKLL
ncbi:MAG: hypothetical protein LBD52_07725 [Prevotellaceae bacterium]|nr:hypothetical protein [Prevotellaceae bacterium]